MWQTRSPLSNIGPGEQRKRALLGYGLLALSVILAACLLLSSSPVWWYLTLFLPLWGSMLGLQQARHKT